jgi:hypothetical protein
VLPLAAGERVTPERFNQLLDQISEVKHQLAAPVAAGGEHIPSISNPLTVVSQRSLAGGRLNRGSGKGQGPIPEEGGSILPSLYTTPSSRLTVPLALL